jgi:hypothetical protein
MARMCSGEDYKRMVASRRKLADDTDAVFVAGIDAVVVVVAGIDELK